MSKDIVVLLNNPEGRKLIQSRCREFGIPVHIFERLIEAEIAQQGKQRRAGIGDDFDTIFGEMIDAEMEEPK